MNKLFAAALVATASFGVSAQELLTFNDRWGAPKSRAEVRAELAQAVAAGQVLSQGEASLYPQPAREGRMLSRDEVRLALAGYVAPHPEAGEATPSTGQARRVARVAGMVVAR